MIKRKSGFTLIELMAVLAIFSIFLVMVFGVFQQGYKIINKTDNLSDIENQFRNTVMDIENEAKNYGSEDIQINDILTYEIKSYTDITPIVLMRQNDKLEENILYFKGKKEGGTKYSLEKIVFSNSDLSSGNFVSKETKSMMQSIDGDVIAEVDDKGSLLTLEFSGVSKNNDKRNYSSVVRLDNDTSIALSVQGTENPPIKPDPPIIEDDKTNEGAFIDALLANTLVVLDENPCDTYPNILRIEGGSKTSIQPEVTYYVQSVSQKSLIDNITWKTLKEPKNAYDYLTADKRIKMPSLSESRIKENGLNCTGDKLEKVLNTTGNSNINMNENGDETNNTPSAIISADANNKFLLVNGDLTIMDGDLLRLAPRAGGSSNLHDKKALVIYVTGRVYINVDKFEMSQCQIVSGKGIYINANEGIIKNNTINIDSTVKYILNNYKK